MKCDKPFVRNLMLGLYAEVLKLKGGAVVSGPWEAAGYGFEFDALVKPPIQGRFGSYPYGLLMGE